jgi:hypothetical protein
MFQGNVLALSSGSKSTLVGLVFKHESVGWMFLLNPEELLIDYVTSPKVAIAYITSNPTEPNGPNDLSHPLRDDALSRMFSTEVKGTYYTGNAPGEHDTYQFAQQKDEQFRNYTTVTQMQF